MCIEVLFLKVDRIAPLFQWMLPASHHLSVYMAHCTQLSVWQMCTTQKTKPCCAADMQWGLCSVLNQSPIAHTFLWVGGLLRSGLHVHWEGSLQGCPISAEKQQCVSREVCTRGGMSSIITPAPGLFQPFSLSGSGRKERQNDSGQPTPGVTRDCTRTDWIQALLLVSLLYAFSSM